MVSTTFRTSDETSLSFVCDENLGSGILIETIAVKPSLTSSPEMFTLFFLVKLLSSAYLLIILVKAVLNPSRWVPPSF